MTELLLIAAVVVLAGVPTVVGLAVVALSVRDYIKGNEVK